MAQQRLHELKTILEPDIKVTSRWIDVDRPEDPTPEFFRQNGMQRAQADLIDIVSAEILVLDTLDGYGRRGGMMFEAGYAKALNMPIFLVGTADCIFTQLFPRWPDWPSVIEHIRRLP